MATSRLQSIPVTQEDWLKSQRGMVYYHLRKSVFEVSIPVAVVRYEAYVKNTDKADVHLSNKDYFVITTDPRSDKKAEISTGYEADMDMTFGINVEKVESAWQNTKDVSLALDDAGMLTSVNGQFEDKKAAVIKNVIKTALDTAKVASGVVLKSNVIYKPKVLEGHTYVVKKRFDSGTLKSKAISNSSGTRCTVDMSGEIKKIIDLARTRLKEDTEQNESFSEPEGNNGFFIPSQIRISSIALQVSVPGGKPPTRTALNADLRSMKNKEGTLDGIVVQKPRAGRVALLVDGRPVAESATTLSDFAGITLIDVRGKSFADNQRKLTLGAAGGLKGYTATSTSQAEAVSGLVSEQTTGILKAEQEIDASQLAEQKAAGTRLNSLHVIDLEILKKQNEIAATTLELDKATVENAPNKETLAGTLAVKKKELENLEEKRRLTAIGAI